MTVRWRALPMDDGVLFGQFDTEGDSGAPEIHVSRVLRAAGVPDAVVMFVVYHEMLHSAVDMEHSPAFMSAEALYPHRAEAEAWLDEFVLRS